MSTAEINSAVATLVGNDEPFTAYSIFQALRKNGLKDAYTAVKKDIHLAVKGFVDAGVYQCSKITSPSGDALLYHPPGYDPTTFFNNNSPAKK